ncbi:MAG: ABC transporter permease [Planctomycetaceae bacterium]|nr:ABC transporter permease [Planctomycetaceae bacterium]
MTRNRPLRAAAALAWREIIRFFRQRNRIIGSIGTPLVFWLLFGAGLSQSFRLGGSAAGGPSFLQYFFPGSLLLIVLFTAIFSSISIIEDRREGFLQGVLVAPIPRWAMVLGKVLGGTLVALVQGLIFLLLALTLPIEVRPLAWLALVVLLFFAALALTSLGFAFAWRTDSSQGFHAIMNLVLMPMWLLSGGFFPAPDWSAEGHIGQQMLHAAMRVNPLSYAVAGVRQLLSPNLDYGGSWVPGMASCWVVTILFAAVCFTAAVLISRQRMTGDLL